MIKFADESGRLYLWMQSNLVDAIRFLDEISIHIVPGHASYMPGHASYMRYSDELKPETMRFRNCNDDDCFYYYKK